MTLPSNRPFFSNFLAAFRAQSALQKSAGAASSPSTTSAFAQNSAASSAASSAANGARSLSTKTATQPQTITGSNARQSSHQFQPSRQHAASPLSRSPGPASPGYHTPIANNSRRRRGSDSSNEGFRDALGSEKWYIGGRAPNGEETFYKLSMVKRPRSVDRLSMDRLSL